jgi:glyoxylase-like metal-dependent hydrolase (beta-lactamase superfamily II)
MPNFVCVTCGTQYAESAKPPEECRICTDERQYVGLRGQRWTTLDRLRTTHWNTIRAIEPGLIGIGMEPKFAIGQRALLVRGPAGNVLWDCIPLLDEALIEAVRAMGGISAIAISHPHYYTTMVEWSRAFDAPIYLAAADRQWVMRSGPEIKFWDGETKEISGGLTLIRCGGHFEAAWLFTGRTAPKGAVPC